MRGETVAFGNGAAWLGAGWNIFMKNPGIWIVFFILLLVIAVVLAIIPIIGQLALALITPALYGGLIYAAHRCARDEKIDVGDMFQAFRDKEKLTPMLVLGAVMVAFQFILAMIAVMFLGGMAAMIGMNADPELASAGIGMGAIFVMLVVLAISLAFGMAYFFAVPLVMLRGVPPMEAMQNSLGACLRNIPALFLYSILIFVAAIVAAIPLGLGFFVLFPVIMGSWYSSFIDIYPASGEAETLG